MSKRDYSWLGAFTLIALFIVGSTLLRSREAAAQGQYPVMDKVAAKVIAKYQNSSCEQLREQKAAPAQPSLQEQRAIGLLRGDPQMRTVFINKVAAPIANKMFECGMIP